MSRTPAPGDASPQMVEALDRWDDEGGAATSVRFDAVLAEVSSLTAAERQVLDCLGAAVVIRWSDLPTAVQRTLFCAASADAPSSMPGDLRLRIARFLHDHKSGTGNR